MMIVSLFILLINDSYSQSCHLLLRKLVTDTPSIHTINLELKNGLSVEHKHLKKWLDLNPNSEFKWLPERIKSTSHVEAIPVATLEGKLLSEIDRNLYFSHFHYNNKAAPYAKNKRVSMETLTKEQPYLKWNGSSFEYIPYGASNEILTSISKQQKTITLYRGSSQAEWSNLQKARKDSSPLETRKTFSAVFFTPDLAAAKRWGSDAVIEVRVTTKELEELMSEGQLYIGVEDDYIEMGFHGEDALNLYLNKARLSKK